MGEVQEMGERIDRLRTELGQIRAAAMRPGPPR